jgi:hypothetical protein
MTHDRVEAECTCTVPQVPYGHFVCALHGIDPRERPYERVLSDDELED